MNGKISIMSISRGQNETTMVGHLEDCWQGLENCSNKVRTYSDEYIIYLFTVTHPLQIDHYINYSKNV